VLTETVSDEKAVISTEPMPGNEPSNEKVVERKTIVYETLVDSTVIKVAGEKIKDQLFARFGFLKPSPREIQFVSIDKYYEPYIVISGRYALDYYRKCAYKVKVDKDVLEVILLNNKFKPEKSTYSPSADYNLIKLEGEERLTKEVKASLVLGRAGQDVTLEKLPSAPSERHPKKVLAELCAEEIAQDEDLGILRSKIIKRPKDINRIVSELFEVNERAVIYTPRFRVLFKNMRTGEEKIVEFDGVTAKRIQQIKH
jgi:hypothetical protein